MTLTTVSSVREIYTALSTAVGGDIIELEAGTYDKIAIWRGLGFDVKFDGPVTIRSADPENRAVISEMGVNGAANLVFDNLVFDYDAPEGGNVRDRPYEIKNSTNITISNSLFDGDLASGVDERADGFGTGMALSVRDSSGITIDNNEFRTFYKALALGDGTDFKVTNNDIHSIRADGMTVTKAQNVLIEGNHIHDFARNMAAGDHADFIQFWTNGNKEPITDITIRGNKLDIGDGFHTQSIFMRNEAVDVQGAGEDMFYQRITIEDNLILNAHINGIVIGATNDLVMHNNMILHADGAIPRNDGHRELPAVRIDGNSTNVQLTQNTAVRFPDGADRDDWTVADNNIVQNLFAERSTYYESAEKYLDTAVWAISEGYSEAMDKILVQTSAVERDAADYDFSDGYTADFSALTAPEKTKGAAHYDPDSDVFVFEGDRSALNLGKLDDYRDTDELTVNVNYVLDENDKMANLFNNHMRLAVSIEEDVMVLRVATRDEGYKRYEIEGLEVETGEEQQLAIAIDRDEDRLQVVLNDEIILNDTETDFVHRDGLHNWGWTLGSPWHNSIDGTVAAFNLSDRAQFQAEVAEVPDTASVLPDLALEM